MNSTFCNNSAELLRTRKPATAPPGFSGDQFRAFLRKIQIHHSSFGQLTLGMGVFRRFTGSPDCKDLKNNMEEVNLQGI